MDSIQYILERHKYGWAVKAPPFRGGVPMDCLSEIIPMMPKGAVLDSGLGNALKAIFVIGTTENCAKWREEIEKALETTAISWDLKWLRGTDVGLSSVTIFIALTADRMARGEAQTWLGSFDGSTPADPGDFGRCCRLLARNPHWESELYKVGDQFPKTKWKEMAAQWDKLKAMYQSGNRKMLHDELRAINESQ